MDLDQPENVKKKCYSRKFMNNASDNRIPELGRLIVKIINITSSFRYSETGAGIRARLEGVGA